MFRLGLIINPLAGLGGSVALKGSDNVAELALSKGAQAKSNQRAKIAFEVFAEYKDQIQVLTCAGDMGENLVRELGFSYDLIDAQSGVTTTADDTKKAAAEITHKGVDLLVFAGGDGTARDICQIVDDAFPVLGIPAGVKIHSGVYGVTPTASGEVVKRLIAGDIIDLKPQDVRDIDEQAFRNNQVKAKLFGEMLVPQVGQFVQSVKQGGIEQEELVLDDIAAHLTALLEPDVLYLVGSGKTTQFFMDSLHLPNTLLGVDAICNEQTIGQDLTEQDILALLDKYAEVNIIVSVIGGQGHILGRGNQQLSAKVIERVGRNNLLVIATKTKLKQLEGRPLVVDSGDPKLDKQLAGYIEVITGYEDKVLYPVG